MRIALPSTLPPALFISALVPLLLCCHAMPGQTSTAEPRQEGSGQAEASSGISASLPDAPSAQDGTAAQRISPTGQIPALLAPQVTPMRLSAHDKFAIYLHQASSPVGFVLPAFGAGISMANPKKGYPPEWRDGGDGYGRLIGDRVAKRQSEKAAQVLTQVALHEDPRYLPLDKGSPLRRSVYALKFALIDRSDAGHSMPAFSNFAGAAAHGFVGIGYLPDGYNDTTHAGQQALQTMAGYGVGNLANEFCPTWSPLITRFHLPFVHPPCPERMHGAVKDPAHD